MGSDTHVLQKGETMRDVSQNYAIKLSRLYTLNRLTPETEPSAGTVLQLRKALKKEIPVIFQDIPADTSGEEEEIKVELNFD